MDTWLKAHAFFVTAISGAIYLAGGDCQRLSKDDATLRLMVTGVREGFGALRALGLTATPFALRVLFAWLPSTFAVNYWRRFLTAETADYIFGRHSRAAPTEMRELAKDCQTLLEKANVEGAALHRLYVAIDAYAGQHPPTIPG
jgi:2-dehydropantoate 2-reductase